MKQEHVSARFMLYDGLHSSDVHYSDRGVLLCNTQDRPSFGIAIEKIKCAFRMVYSLFDKIAQFINHCWGLGVRTDKVALRRIWYCQDVQASMLRPEFRDNQNWPLRGLFWLSRDFFDRAPGFRDYTDPDACAMDKLRNRLEHGFLSVHGSDWHGLADGDGSSSDPFYVDANLYSVSCSELARKTLRVMQLARAGMIYLALAMHREEELRAAKRTVDEGIIPIDLGHWEADWKC